MENKKYFIGLDIGTDSVGYAVTDEHYKLCSFKGEPMWGVTLFDEAQLANTRRAFRSARRRLDRRQQRVALINELFAKEISKIDPSFFIRRQNSFLQAENDDASVRVFDSLAEQKAYSLKYPTIHHLIYDLMNDSSRHDVRLVYLACAWLVAHRGHFLSEVDKKKVNEVTDFNAIYNNLISFLSSSGGVCPWGEDVDVSHVEEALKLKAGVSKKHKRLCEVLFEQGRAPKIISDDYIYNYDLLTKLLCGGKVSLKDLFGKDEYEDLEKKSVALNMADEDLEIIMDAIGDDADLIIALKSVYDWSVLVDVLDGKATISEAKVEVYEKHKSDLKFLKKIIKKYAPDKYFDVFKSSTEKANYVAYSHNLKSCDKKRGIRKVGKEDFSKYILSIVKGITPDESDASAFSDMMARLELLRFLPKQIDGDNRVIPYQLYWFELDKILDNAKEYIPFIREKDCDGISGAEKILSVFEFRVPYFVGPLKTAVNGEKGKNHWMVRKAEGRILPWNFESVVDLDASEQAFISRMTNTCTYLPGEEVLPKNSLLYNAFNVLNEINNIKINGEAISVSAKQSIFNNLFLRRRKVTPKAIKEHLISNHYSSLDDTISGIDDTVKSSLSSFIIFRNLVDNGTLTPSQAEMIITRATYSEDKSRFTKWLSTEFPALNDSDIKYISNQKFKDFGRLSRKFLCGIEGVDKSTGEIFTIIRALWETNLNLMQLLSDRFTFSEQIEAFVREYYSESTLSISERLDELHISNASKRPIIRTLDILKDVVKVKGSAPEAIFVEMARGANEDQKGVRTKTRYQQLCELYEKIDTEEVRRLQEQLESFGDTVHNVLQSDKIFLYFIQLGRCLYTDKPISLESVISGDGQFNVEHIYPRSFVKDDSILNNKILVDSIANGEKSDVYPIDAEIQQKMHSRWEHLHRIGLLGDEKYKRLTRRTRFSDEERFEFINRQLVETRQSTKAIATLLKEMYPEAEIVYVKAGLVSEFRQKFDLLKSRSVNDLHHAKDAYLNVVVGNVWHSKFSRQFWRAEEACSIKPEVIFTRKVFCQGRLVWEGTSDLERVKKTVRKNTAHITVYSYCRNSGQNGGFFDQNPLSAAPGLIPLKKGLPTELYGGYDSATVSGFVLARYTTGKNTEVSFVPLTLLFMKKFISDSDFAREYLATTLGEKAKDIELLLNGRIIKNFATISLDGARFCIRGKADLSSLALMNIMPFMTSPSTEDYIKKLEAFNEKRKKNEHLVYNERFDGVSRDKNLALYDLYAEKLSHWPYSKRPGNAVLLEKLKKRRALFAELDISSQVYTLLQLQGLFGRIRVADLKYIKESSSSGIAKLSLNLSNWKKAYSDVRIVDSSASGLFESEGQNLLELL